MKETTKKKFKRSWDWVKDHKYGIAFGTGIVIFVTGLIVNNKKNDDLELNPFNSVPEELLPYEKTNRFIDEDIFTNIAPQIEDLVLEEGADEGYIDVTYDVAFPKFGDYRNGTYNVKKKVEVYVRDMCE